MNRARLVWLIVLILAVLSSGIGVVYAKNQSRALFVDLQKVRLAHDLAVMEWGRLQLELASEGGLEQVMQVATGRLKMHAPAPADVVVIE